MSARGAASRATAAPWFACSRIVTGNGHSIAAQRRCRAVGRAVDDDDDFDRSGISDGADGPQRIAYESSRRLNVGNGDRKREKLIFRFALELDDGNGHDQFALESLAARGSGGIFGLGWPVMSRKYRKP